MIIKNHFQKLILLLTVLCLTSASYAQTVLKGEDAKKLYKEAGIVRTSKHSSLPSYIKFDSTISEVDLIPWLQENLNLNSNIGFLLINKEVDQLGFHHYRYRQTFKGNAIEAATLVVHVRNNRIESMNGLIHEEISAAAIPAITEFTALERAKEFVGGSQYKWEIPEEESHLKWETDDLEATYYPTGELVFYSEGLTFKKESYKLAYKFDIYAQIPLYRAHVYVDAISGKVLGENLIIHCADTPGTAVTAYSGSQTIIADSFVGGYRLRDASRGLGIRTFDISNGFGYGGALDFVDTDNIWNNVNPALDEYATDAHWGAEMTYDYFLDEHGRNSIDNAGFQLNSYVHYGINYVNAFWDGMRMTYGDGDGVTFSPLTSLDIAGHEITHGLTSLTANLIYYAESGALNESFSDIFGTAIENFARPGDWDWLLSDDIGLPFRSLKNPKLYGHPNTYFGVNWAPLAGPDNGGVHTNSGVQNYWYYLLVSGGAGTNDIGDAYLVNGLDFTSASAIAFRNLTVYLTDASDHADARFFAIQSAIDLFGECSKEEKETTNAWYAVGVGPEYVSNITADFASTIGCFPIGEVIFSDLSAPLAGVINSWEWDFSDGSTAMEENPTHIFASTGTYPVELKVITDLGCEDSLTIDINVYDAPLAEFSSANYCQGELTEFTNEATIPSGVINAWSWSFGDAETAVDENPAHAYATADSFDAKLIVTSDNGCKDSITKTILITPAPVTDFTFKDACINQKITFKNTTTYSGGIITDYFWEFGDGATSTTVSPIHTYTAPGVYTVKLTSTSDSDCASDMSYDIEIFNEPTANYTVADHCFETNASFTDISTIDAPDVIITQLWNFGDGATGIGSPALHTFAASGTYDVILEVISVNGCSNKINLPVIVHPKPTAKFNIEANICVNGATPVITNLSTIIGGGALTYEWDFGDGVTSNLMNPKHKFLAPGTYNIKLVVESEFGCTNEIIVPTKVFEKPTASFTSTNPIICSPDCIEFTSTATSATTTIKGTRWEFGDGQFSLDANPTPCFLETVSPNSYNVRFIAQNTYGCKDTLLMKDYIKVSPTPIADFNYGPERIDILYPEVTFENKTISGYTYQWDFGDYSAFSFNANPVHLYNPEAKEYRVILTAISQDGLCSSFAEKIIRVKDVVIFYIPNAFTPDGDVFNDELKPVFMSGYDPYDYHFTVFNRWGEKVFESYDAAYGWDGYFGSKGLAESGVYIWTIEFKETMSDKRRVESGHITLLR